MWPSHVPIYLGASFERRLLERQCGSRGRAVGVTSTDLSASCRGPSLVRPMLKKRAPSGLRTPLRTAGNWEIFIRLWDIGLDTSVFSLQAPNTAPRNPTDGQVNSSPYLTFDDNWCISPTSYKQLGIQAVMV